MLQTLTSTFYGLDSGVSKNIMILGRPSPACYPNAFKAIRTSSEENQDRLAQFMKNFTLLKNIKHGAKTISSFENISHYLS
jgi:hypothetical protein